MQERDEDQELQEVIDSLDNIQCQILGLQYDLEATSNEVSSTRELLEDLVERRRRDPNRHRGGAVVTAEPVASLPEAQVEVITEVSTTLKPKAKSKNQLRTEARARAVAWAEVERRKDKRKVSK